MQKLPAQVTAPQSKSWPRLSEMSAAALYSNPYMFAMPMPPSTAPPPLPAPPADPESDPAASLGADDELDITTMRKKLIDDEFRLRSESLQDYTKTLPLADDVVALCGTAVRITAAPGASFQEHGSGPYKYGGIPGKFDCQKLASCFPGVAGMKLMPLVPNVVKSNVDVIRAAMKPLGMSLIGSKPPSIHSVTTAAARVHVSVVNYATDVHALVFLVNGVGATCVPVMPDTPDEQSVLNIPAGFLTPDEMSLLLWFCTVCNIGKSSKQRKGAKPTVDTLNLLAMTCDDDAVEPTMERCLAAMRQSVVLYRCAKMIRVSASNAADTSIKKRLRAYAEKGNKTASEALAAMAAKREQRKEEQSKKKKKKAGDCASAAAALVASRSNTRQLAMASKAAAAAAAMRKRGRAADDDDSESDSSSAASDSGSGSASDSDDDDAAGNGDDEDDVAEEEHDAPTTLWRPKRSMKVKDWGLALQLLKRIEKAERKGQSWKLVTAAKEPRKSSSKKHKH
jgi:hypothetical protein